MKCLGIAAVATIALLVVGCATDKVVATHDGGADACDGQDCPEPACSVADDCPAVSGGTRECSDGACSIASCIAPFEDCDGLYENGCEVDTSADPAKTLYYVVTAVDVHENESDPTNEATADIVSGVDERVPAPEVLTLLPNHPNPFGVRTDLRIGLPFETSVRIDVYDVAGRRVTTRRVAGVRGWQRVSLDGRGLASGVYFCRVEAAGNVITRKVVVTR